MGLRALLTWWDAVRIARMVRRHHQQRRAVSRLELSFRLDQAERMNSKQAMASAREVSRLTRQLDTLRQRQAELDEILRTIRTGVQVLAVEDAAARAREAAASGFGDLEEPPRDLTERSDWGRL